MSSTVSWHRNELDIVSLSLVMLSISYIAGELELKVACLRFVPLGAPSRILRWNRNIASKQVSQTLLPVPCLPVLTLLWSIANYVKGSEAPYITIQYIPYHLNVYKYKLTLYSVASFTMLLWAWVGTVERCSPDSCFHGNNLWWWISFRIVGIEVWISQ